MPEHDTSADMLDDLFAAAREAPAEASPDFMARVLRDAEAEQARFMAGSRPEKARFGWRAALAGLGGWQALGGLVTATAFGIWLGASPLTGLSDAVANLMYGTADGLSGYGADYAWLDTMGDV